MEFRDVFTRIRQGWFVSNSTNQWLTQCQKKTMMDMGKTQTTVKPVCNDHLYNKICYVWFIQ